MRNTRFLKFYCTVRQSITSATYFLTNYGPVYRIGLTLFMGNNDGGDNMEVFLFARRTVKEVKIPIYNRDFVTYSSAQVCPYPYYQYSNK